MRQPILLVALLLVLSVTAVAQQKQAPPSDKEKAEKKRADHYEKFAAPLFAVMEQRKAIIRDLLDTCAKCRVLSQAYVDAAGDDAKSKDAERQMDQCYMVFHAELKITHLEMIAPYAQPVKGADVEDVKWQTMCNICDAYEYGLEQAKKPADKQP